MFLDMYTKSMFVWKRNCGKEIVLPTDELNYDVN